MPFTIQWVAQCFGDETSEALNLPVGTLIVTRKGDVITDINWDTRPQSSGQTANGSIHPWLNPQSDIPLMLLKQGSAYRQQVWAGLCSIPYGTTLTYAGLAKNIGSAARAVGNACRDNPYPLVIPCHRVVSAAGMGGYCGETTGAFVTIKSKLLAFEANNR